MFDLDAVIAEGPERAPFEFTFDGETYTLPPRPDFRGDAALQVGRYDEACRIFLGETQWEKLKASPKVLDDDAFLALYRAYQAYQGDTSGEGEASPSS